MGRLVLAVSVLCLIFSWPLAAQDRLSISTFEGTEIFQQAVLHSFREGGFAVDIQELPPLRSLQMVQEGYLDAELARPEGEDSRYPALQRVPVPLAEDRIFCYIRKDRLEELKDAEADNGKSWDKKKLKAVTIRGFRISTAEAENFGRSEVVPDWKTAFFLLENKTADVFICPEMFFPYGSRSGPFDSGRYTVLGPPLRSFPLFFYINKRRADLVPRLLPLLEKAAQEISGKQKLK